MNEGDMSDEEYLERVLDVLSDERVSLRTGFLSDEDGIFTHQYFIIDCGSASKTSEPQPLFRALRAATDPAEGETIH